VAYLFKEKNFCTLLTFIYSSTPPPLPLPPLCFFHYSSVPSGINTKPRHLKIHLNEDRIFHTLHIIVSSSIPTNYSTYCIHFRVTKNIIMRQMRNTKIDVFWYIAPCGLVDTDQRYRGVYCLHQQGDASITLIVY
jgi:hypothetical protein